mmetsp:Transcript_113242/g.359934  ORF Transcript_113242/g.359934 Transcript_113242/m.359934 type:complete len:216 (-) Transcript_113242:1176-1823(-)
MSDFTSSQCCLKTLQNSASWVNNTSKSCGSSLPLAAAAAAGLPWGCPAAAFAAAMAAEGPPMPQNFNVFWTCTMVVSRSSRMSLQSFSTTRSMFFSRRPGEPRIFITSSTNLAESAPPPVVSSTSESSSSSSSDRGSSSSAEGLSLPLLRVASVRGEPWGEASGAGPPVYSCKKLPHSALTTSKSRWKFRACDCKATICKFCKLKAARSSCINSP